MPYIPPPLPYSNSLFNHGYPRMNFRGGLSLRQRERVIQSRNRASRIRALRRNVSASIIARAFRRRK